MSPEYESGVGLRHDRKCELVREILRSFGTVRIRVTGRSMLPSIWPGDTLVVQRRNAHEAVVGDILLYRQRQRFFAHRVVSVSRFERNFIIRARGDALPEPDNPVSNRQVLGTVFQIFRDGRCVGPSSHLKRHERLIGILTWHSDWLANFAVFAHAIFSAPWRRESRARAR